MFPVEILLPLRDNDAAPFPAAKFGALRRELVERFGGLTAFSRSPAEGLWENGGGTDQDDIVIFEVMADALDRSWWADFRRRLEAQLTQDEIVVRAREVERL